MPKATTFWFPSPHGLARTPGLTSPLDPSPSPPAPSIARFVVPPPPALNAPGTNSAFAHTPDPVVFTPGRGVCRANAVPDGAASLPAWLCSLLLLPSGSLLPRAIRLELRDPGDALFYIHENAQPDGQTAHFGVVHVCDLVASGLTAGKAFSCFARACREVLCAFASSTCSALVLQTPGCARLPTSQAGVLSMAAIQLAAGCLDVTSPNPLRSRPLGMLVSSAAVLESTRSAELTRLAVFPSIGGDAVPEGGGGTAARRPPWAWRPVPARPGLGPPDGGIPPARGTRAAPECIALA